MLILATLLQRIAESMTTLPIGPSRYLLIAVVAFALIPLAIFALEKVLGQPLGWPGRLAVGVLTPPLFILLLVAIVRATPGSWGKLGDRLYERRARRVREAKHEATLLEAMNSK